MKGWAPAALSFVAMSPAAASPAKGPLDDARGRGRVEVLGGTLHPFYCQRTDVTTAEVADKYPTYIVVDRSNFTVTLYRNLQEEKQYTVAIGAEGYDTPTDDRYCINSICLRLKV